MTDRYDANGALVPEREYQCNRCAAGQHFRCTDQACWCCTGARDWHGIEDKLPDASLQREEGQP